MICSASAVLACLFAARMFAADFIYQVNADRADCHYRCGEPATFVVTVLHTNGEKAVTGRISASLDNFGASVQTNATFDLAVSNPFRISGTLLEPGFLRLNLPKTKNVRLFPAVFSVAYEPQRIEKGSPSPDDFDEFWADAVRRLDETVPADPQLRLLPERSTDKFNFWRVSFATYGGARVHGYLSMPKDASAGKRYPVRFEVPAAGGGRAGWTNNMQAEPDAICMTMTVHPYEPPFDLDELEKLFNDNLARLKDKYGDETYPVAGLWKSREDYYFYPVILGINRAVNWLASRPEVNRSCFTYRGTSQGGGFGLYLLGLNRNFTKGALFVPAISDTMGYLKGRESSWPRPVDAQRSKGAERRAAAERNAPYFDGANFAARIECPVRIAVGFSDITCPPCGVYAAFNAIPVKDKIIFDGIGMTHSCRQQFYAELGAWLSR